MDHDTTIEVGAFCELVLASDHFNCMWREFEKTSCHDLLNTKPEDAAGRENIFATFNGARTLLNYMAQLAKTAHELQQPAEPDHEGEQDDEDLNAD